MKLIFVGLGALLVACLVPVQAGETVLSETDATATAQKWAALLISSDANGIENLLAEDYVHTHGTGKVESKKQFVEALRSGARKYERCEMSDLRVIPLGNTAVIHGSLDVKALTPTKTIEGNYRFMMVVTKTNRGIEVTAYQATPMEKKP
ncbi:nuclear transport factor 2 family protein [bacterium]|nr:nuclear transport factor 2 family protein [bacterium]NDA09894.1 nuclear transport factor 2 family protein [Verrucomicrobiota bacterium]NDA25690.1 nuclear transport factor 2 family protein [Verrucomicrobiota bacterium]NDD81559.1 nuclear transport factor 2 family protein [Verrucomicrobiota bacterium]